MLSSIRFRIRSLALLLPIVLLLAPQPAPAQPWAVHEGLTNEQYEEMSTRMVEDGHRLVDLGASAVNDTVRFSTVWETTAGPAWTVSRKLTPSEYAPTQKKMKAEGYAPATVSGYVVDGQVQLAVRWEKDVDSKRRMRHGLSPDRYAVILKQMAAKGYQPVDLSAYVVDGQPRFAVVWEKTESERKARLNLSPDTYKNVIRPRMEAMRFHPVDVSGYVVGGQLRYAGIWEEGTADRTVRTGLTPRNYESTFWNLAYRGQRPVQVASYAGPEQVQVAGIWKDAYPNDGLSSKALATIRERVQSFMDTYEVPGLSIAIAKNERLVFAQGYGTAIKEDSVRTGPHHRFRIASVSKPVTSAAILRLWDNDQLQLDQKVLGPDGLLGTRLGDEPYGPNEKKLTVRHLLNHTTGGWSKDGPDSDSDPLFHHKDLSREELLGWVLDSWSLDRAPGSEYAYSNIGYALLGRVIEAVSGQSYEAYVKQNVLRPAGIHNMAIAQNRRADRRSDEVAYYSQGDFHPYDYNVARHDANAGWIASAVDLARFGVHVDGFSAVPDILSTDAARHMTDAVISSEEVTGDVKRWNWTHTGKLSGCCTASLLVLRNPGEELEGNYVLSVLMNTESPKSSFMDERTRLPREVAEAVAWPSYDLFDAPAASVTNRAQSRSQQEPPNEETPEARDTDVRPSGADSWPTDQFDPAVLPPGVDEHNEAGTNLPDVSRRVGTITNEERTTRGRAPLEFNEQLSLIACRHNKDMLAHDYMGHEDSDGRRIDDRLPREHRTLLVRRHGENVSQASGEYARRENFAPIPMKWWMDSPGHRENILRPQYTHLGACVTRKGDKMRSTQVFANVVGELDDPLPWSVPAGDSLSLAFSSPSATTFDRYLFLRADNADRHYEYEETRPFDGTVRVPTEPGLYRLKMVIVEPKGDGSFRYFGGASKRIRVQAP